MPLILLRSQFATYAAQCRSRRAEALRGRKAGGTCRYLSTPFSTPFPLAASHPPRLPPPLLRIRCLIANLTQDRDSTFPPFVAAGPAPVADPLAARHNGPRPESIPVYAQRTDNSILSVNPLFHTAKGCAAPSARAAIISLEYVPLSVSRSVFVSLFGALVLVSLAQGHFPVSSYLSSPSPLASFPPASRQFSLFVSQYSSPLVPSRLLAPALAFPLLASQLCPLSPSSPSIPLSFLPLSYLSSFPFNGTVSRPSPLALSPFSRLRVPALLCLSSHSPLLLYPHAPVE